MVSAFFDLAELRAIRHQPMYMKDWVVETDDFAKRYGKGILSDAGAVSHKEAVEKAEAEYAKYRQRTIDEPTLVERDYLASIKETQKKLEGKCRILHRCSRAVSPRKPLGRCLRNANYAETENVSISDDEAYQLAPICRRIDNRPLAILFAGLCRLPSDLWLLLSDPLTPAFDDFAVQIKHHVDALGALAI